MARYMELSGGDPSLNVIRSEELGEVFLREGDDLHEVAAEGAPSLVGPGMANQHDGVSFYGDPRS